MSNGIRFEDKDLDHWKETCSRGRRNLGDFTLHSWDSWDGEPAPYGTYLLRWHEFSNPDPRLRSFLLEAVSVWVVGAHRLPYWTATSKPKPTKLMPEKEMFESAAWFFHVRQNAEFTIFITNTFEVKEAQEIGSDWRVGTFGPLFLLKGDFTVDWSHYPQPTARVFPISRVYDIDYSKGIPQIVQK